MKGYLPKSPPTLPTKLVGVMLGDWVISVWVISLTPT